MCGPTRALCALDWTGSPKCGLQAVRRQHALHMLPPSLSSSCQCRPVSFARGEGGRTAYWLTLLSWMVVAHLELPSCAKALFGQTDDFHSLRVWVPCWDGHSPDHVPLLTLL